MRHLRQLFDDLKADRRGATAIEYALIASLISVAIIGGVAGSGTALQSSLQNTLNEIAAAFGL